MSFEKSQVIANALFNAGVRIDDILEGAKRDHHRFEGGQVALLQVLKQVQALTSHVDKDVEEGKLNTEQATLVKVWIERAVAVIESGSQTMANNAVGAHGQVLMAEKVVKVLKTMHDVELSKADVLQRAEAGEVIDGAERRQVGEHPGPGVRVRRQQQQQAEQDTKAPVTKTISVKQRRKEQRTSASNTVKPPR